MQPTPLVESVGVHGLLAMAAAGQGIAIIPSVLKIDRRALRTMRVTQRRQPLQISLAVLWDRRRMPTEQAERCGAMLARHVLETFPQAKAANGGVESRRRNFGRTAAAAAAR